MTRNLKALGVALAVAFAFAATATAASATTHHIHGTPGKLSVTGNTINQFTSTTGSGKGYTCETVGVEGELIEETSTSITVEPKYSNCFETENDVKGKVKVFVRPNGCHYTFTGLTTSGNPTGGEHATVDIVCPAGKQIEIRATGLELICSDIPEQEVKDAVRYNDLGTGTVEVQATAHGIKSTTTGACGEGEHNNGGYTGNVTVTNEAHDLSVVSTP